MKKSLYAIITVFLFMSLCSFSECDNRRDGHEYITVINDSDDTICWEQYYFSGMTVADTFYNQKGSIFEVPPHTVYDHVSWNHYWETSLEGLEYSGVRYIQWLFMDWKKYKEYRDSSEAVIREKVPVVKILRFTLEDLEKCNWTVSFPSYPSYNSSVNE